MSWACCARRSSSLSASPHCWHWAELCESLAVVREGCVLACRSSRGSLCAQAMRAVIALTLTSSDGGAL
jgi:hypothetical protein